MKNNTPGIFRRISILVFLIITILSILFISITYFASTYFYNTTTQLVNKDVATHIAKFTSPYENNSINKRKADSVFYNAMVVNPNIEVYFLDATGNVIYYQTTEFAIQVKKIPLDDIHTFINSNGKKYVRGFDPKQAGVKKIFSAAPVYKNNTLFGYIYVILVSAKYGDANSVLFESQVWRLALEAFIIVIILSIFISNYYIKRLQLNYKKVVTVLEEYKNGNFNATFALKDNYEFVPITDAFNSMSHLLITNMKRLQKSETDRKDLIATISHDLQSPLSVARGYAETLFMQKNFTGTPEHHEYLKLIQSKIMQVEKMVLQLAQLSKMDEINFEPKKEPFVFAEIVQETVNTYQLFASEKNVALHCSQCETLEWINADVSMMERVMQNLVDNAIKNTPAGGTAEISITVKENDLIFSIENTGKNLSPELLKWINSLGEELSERPSQAGLGLLIVKKILRLHNIQLTAKTYDNKNIFMFTVHVVSQSVSI
ncbi:MAG: HAMP domain-containing sensor histidine kinase [Chitinophagaceae bacterium]